MQKRPTQNNAAQRTLVLTLTVRIAELLSGSWATSSTGNTAVVALWNRNDMWDFWKVPPPPLPGIHFYDASETAHRLPRGNSTTVRFTYRFTILRIKTAPCQKGRRS